LFEFEIRRSLATNFKLRKTTEALKVKKGCVTQPFLAFAKNGLPESQTWPESRSDCT
jgi:hypothetical protein